MGQFFQMIADLWAGIIAQFDQRPLQIGNYSVSVTALIFAFIVIGFVVSLFWKGART